MHLSLRMQPSSMRGVYEVMEMEIEGICEGRDGGARVIPCFWFNSGVVVVDDNFLEKGVNPQLPKFRDSIDLDASEFLFQEEILVSCSFKYLVTR